MDFTHVHILFCDHDSSTGSETLSLLQKCSYKVTTVKSARQVVDALESEDSHVDIVLTDVELPQEEGFKMLKQILRQDNLSHIAVVVMSEHDEMAVVAKCLRLGVVDYLVKPLRLNEVMNLWTHMWRKRRAMGLPDKLVGIASTNVSQNFQKPGKTADLLSGYKNTESPSSPTDALHAVQSREDTSLQLELSLRLSLSYSANKLPEHAHGASWPTPANGGTSQPSAFSAYLRSCSLQPDEQSGTDACSPSSSSPSKRSRYSSECITNRNRDSVEVPADAFLSSPKDASVPDETRSADMESQLYGRLTMAEVPLQCFTTDERIFHVGQKSAAHAQGLQPCYAFMGSPPKNMQQGTINMQQGVTANVREATTPGYNIALNPSHVQQLPLYCHESGMANIPPVPNFSSYYPVVHLAVPVVNFSTWPALITPPPIVGQAERREAALSKFRLKRKGRCFEKKIRYASRKKLAEQRPRVRGQFVKRSAVADNTGIQAVSDEEGEADDEQGCSELYNHSSPDCIAQNSRVG